MKKSKGKIGIVGNLIAVTLAVAIMWPGLLQRLEFAFYDYAMDAKNRGQPHEDILVITVDESSIEALGRWAWPRDVHAALIETLNEPGNEPKVIAFDVLFDTYTDAEVDAYLAETLSRYDNVIFPSFGILESDLSRFTTVTKGELIRPQKMVHPIPPFYEVTEHAHINAVLDRDGVIRRTWLQLQTPDGEVIDSLALKAAKMAGADVDRFLHVHDQAELYINFEAESYDFESVSYIDALTGVVPPENFRDRIVLVGITAVALNSQDTGSVPIEVDMPLVYVHANIIHQLLTNTFIYYAPDWIVYVLAFIAMAVIAAITWRLKTVVSLSMVLIASLALMGGSWLLFTRGDIFINAVDPLAVMLIAYIVNISIKAYFETRHKNFITQQFGRYISPDLVKQIASSERELPLGGISKELSILFLDIRGFTTLSEKLKPTEVVDLLNMMFNLITEKTLENKGTIDKFIGDAAMLIFNAPLDLPNHEYYAVKTAYDIQKGMENVRAEILDKYGVEVSIGIGVNTGEVVVGNIGSYIRVDYTAIGDHVNIAARIESNTVANQILVSETTYERTKSYFDYRCIGERMMKGKTVPVKLYEVIGLKKELQEQPAAANL